MTIYLRPIFYLLFLVCTQTAFAQYAAITDSLTAAVEKAFQKNDKGNQAQALRELGLHQAQGGNFIQAIENTERAIDMYESLNKPIEISKCYRTMMVTHYTLHNVDKLQEYGEKSLKIGLEHNDTTIIAHSYSVLSVVCIDKKEYKKGLELNLKALKLNEGKSNVALIHNNLSVAYTGLGDYSNAIKYAQLAIQAYKGDTVEVIGSMMNEVRAWAMSGNVSAAQNVMNEIEKIIKQYGQHPDERYTHWLNYLILEGKKDYKQALHHFIQYHEMDSVITSEAHHLQFVQAETAYETKKKEQENERLATQVQRQKLFFGGAVLGLLVLGAFFYMQRHQLKIKNKLLETEQILAAEKLQNAEHELQNFTQSLKEKTDAFEKLKAEVATQSASTDRDNLLAHLTEASILTEEHWRDVRLKFERVYPQFFMQLQTAVPDITDAEKRLAALTKLDLTTHEIAAILGITHDTVVKTRYRFRKKLEGGDLVGLLERL